MTNQEPQGCLTAILGLIGIRLGGQTNPTQQLPYRLRDDFLSPAELSFYRVLQLAVRDRATIVTKVNLADIFFVARPNENQLYRNKIDRKHVDFLLCDLATMKPRCGIELDDSSHARRDRQERDEFVDQVFHVAGLPLLRFPARASYDPKAIASELAKFLDATQIELPAAISIPSSGLPICPKCNLPMVERVASKGPNKGKQFWGCQNYPRCREVA
jgi:very-short-patch-repair endonuclease